MHSGVFRHGARISALVMSLALLTIVAGCGDDNSNTTATSATTTATDHVIAGQLPQSSRDKGTLTVATDPSYAPNEFFDTDGKTIIGMDIDLARALGGVLGLKVQPTQVVFDSILPGLASGRYDVGMSSFTDTKERQKQVDFVTYYSAGTSFMTRGQGGVEIATLADLCGRTVAVETGTTQQTDAGDQSGRCTAAGRPKVTVQNYDDQNGANLALTAGRAEVSMADSPVADYQAKLSGGKIRIVGKPYGTAPYGIAVPKNSGLAAALRAAMAKLIDDGAYAKILDRWGVRDGAISAPRINGATG
ncbi:amino acid ABC transporter substrate-binding protein, PAAT family [Frankia torreyi]|uniref:Amino acid ABC transporter substrate-binding protein, PAAT family n=2 Tax=Frankiaceae TaxID=74712 RepID=A0A0D8BFW5_9ACTN|nr:amino acid ABC transporter substrate-binding protein, PAAT family [Frankia torreyi]